MRSSPGPARTLSSPLPGKILSSPLPPLSLSSPPRPSRRSFPLVPLKVSGPLVPILLTAKATPLASSSAKAIAPNTSTTRRILFSSPYAPHRSVCAQGNKAVRLALLLPRIHLLGTSVNKEEGPRLLHPSPAEKPQLPCSLH